MHVVRLIRPNRSHPLDAPATKASHSDRQRRSGPHFSQVALGDAAEELAGRGAEGPQRVTTAALARGHLMALFQHVAIHFHRMPTWLATHVRDTLLHFEHPGSAPMADSAAAAAAATAAAAAAEGAGMSSLSPASLAARPLLAAADTIAAPAQQHTAGLRLAAEIAAAMFELPCGALSRPSTPNLIIGVSVSHSHLPCHSG
jgi:hypothetical protein